MYEKTKQLLIGAARHQSLLHYEDLGVPLETDYDRAEVGRILGEISREEVEAGRPMLSALVVHKGGDEMPGGGFFGLAKELGAYTGGDRKLWWATETQATLRELGECWRGGRIISYGGNGREGDSRPVDLRNHPAYARAICTIRVVRDQ